MGTPKQSAVRGERPASSSQTRCKPPRYLCHYPCFFGPPIGASHLSAGRRPLRWAIFFLPLSVLSRPLSLDRSLPSLCCLNFGLFCAAGRSPPATLGVGCGTLVAPRSPLVCTILDTHVPCSRFLFPLARRPPGAGALLRAPAVPGDGQVPRREQVRRRRRQRRRQKQGGGGGERG